MFLKLQKFKLFYENELHTFNSYETMREYIDNILFIKCSHLKNNFIFQ